MPTIPDKKFFKTSEVCRLADTQPYVLRFWESEFPQLAPTTNRSGQSTYSRRDLKLVLRISELLHDQELSIAQARELLEKEKGGRAAPAATAKKQKKTAKKGKKATTKTPAARDRLDEMRKRYEAACEEIASLKESLKAAGGAGKELQDAREEIAGLRKRVQQLRKDNDRYKKKVEGVTGRLTAIERAFGKLAAAGPKK